MKKQVTSKTNILKRIFYGARKIALDVLIWIAVVIISIIAVTASVPRTTFWFLGTTLLIYSLLVQLVNTGWFVPFYEGYSLHLFIVSSIILCRLGVTTPYFKEFANKKDVRLQ